MGEGSQQPLGRLPEQALRQDIPGRSGADFDDIDSFRADPCPTFIVINQLLSQEQPLLA